MRSMSSDSLQGSRRGIDNFADQVRIGQASARSGGGEACVWVEAGIDVNLEDPGLAAGIDAEIDPGVAGELEQVPTGLGERLEFRGERQLALLDAETARRADIDLAIARPLGVVADDARAPLVPVLEQDLGHRQHARVATLLEQGDVELAAFDIAFREMLGAE